MKTIKLDELIKQLLASQKLAVLSTQDEGHPYLNLVAFAVSPDFKTAIFVTDKKTRKYQNMVKNPLVSLLVDNRKNQVTDFEEASALTLIGSADVLEDKSSQMGNVFLDKHLNLSDFLNDPQKALIKVKITDYILAGFVNTQSIHLEETDSVV
jgi:nitroimidazol reductase NimA-like FMN-containing flavoprotein (pyridoxamine 5'-phosphate oxidase superfamily)